MAWTIRSVSIERIRFQFSVSKNFHLIRYRVETEMTFTSVSTQSCRVSKCPHSVNSFLLWGNKVKLEACVLPLRDLIAGPALCPQRHRCSVTCLASCGFSVLTIHFILY